jgi:hypothetical protein
MYSGRYTDVVCESSAEIRETGVSSYNVDGGGHGAAARFLRLGMTSSSTVVETIATETDEIQLV